MLLLAISCCFSSGICWSWRRSLRSASANEDLSSVISSSCACSRTSISESLSGNSALLPADTSSEHTDTISTWSPTLNHCYGRYIAFREHRQTETRTIIQRAMMVLEHRMQNNKPEEIQPNSALLISLTVIRPGLTICKEKGYSW